MSALLWIVPAVVGILGLTLVVGGVVHMFRGSLFKGGRGIFGGLFFVAIALVVGLVALNIQTYARLTYERPVAVISVDQRAPQLFLVTMCEPGAKIREFEVNGDDWELQAYVLKWQPWANIVGLDAQYYLTRLQGRYQSADQERTAARSVHELRDTEAEPQMFDPTSWGELFQKGINILSLPDGLQQYAFAVDTTYGNATFKEMVDGGVYRVWMTQDTLLPRAGTREDVANCAAGTMPEAPPPVAPPGAPT